MSNFHPSRLLKVLGLSESFKLSKPQKLKRRISLVWLLLPATALAGVSFLTMRIDSACGCGGGSGEGKMFVGALQRAQQAYFLENNALATSLEALEIGLPPQMKNYRIEMRVTESAAFHYAIPNLDGIDGNKSIGNVLFGNKPKPPLTSFVSAVFLQPTNPQSTQTIPKIILCMTDVPGMVQPEDPILRDGIPTCAPGTHPL